MTTQELQFFNTVAPSWDSRETLSLPDKIQKVLKLAQVKTDDHILDLGTGTGVLLKPLAEAIGSKGTITAVDLSTGMLRIARKKSESLIPKPQFLNIDFENTRIPGKYNHIFLYCVYPHLQNPIETIKKLRDSNLAENGNIIIAFPCDANHINHIHGHNHVDHHRLLPPTELAEMLKQHNINAKTVSDSEDLYLISITREINP